MTMKRFLLHLLYIITFLPFLGSCSVLDDTPTDTSCADKVQISLSITSRALPQEGKETGTGTPERMHLWVYGAMNENQNTNGYKLLSYKLVTSNLFQDSDAFGNPMHSITDLNLPEGKKYNKMFFYVLLNEQSVSDFTIDKNVKEMTIVDLQELAFTGIVSGKTDNQMLMYGEANLDINEHKTNYEVEIPVVRSVAKMELWFTRSNDISNLTINSIELSSPINKGYLVKQENLARDQTIYANNPTSIALIGSGVSIETTSTEEYGDFSKDETNFTQMSLTNPYLMENPNGLTWTGNLTDVQYPDGVTDADGSKYYKITVNYTLDLVDKSESFYLPKIERNELYKIYIRVRQLNWEISVCPYGSYELEPEFGL